MTTSYMVRELCKNRILALSGLREELVSHPRTLIKN